MAKRKRYTVQEMRAMAAQNQNDFDMVAKWKGSQSDVVEQNINCLVCGAPNIMIIHRHNMVNVMGAKYLCEDCTGFGWAWMGNLCAEDPEEAHPAIKAIKINEVEIRSILFYPELWGLIPKPSQPIHDTAAL